MVAKIRYTTKEVSEKTGRPTGEIIALLKAAQVPHTKAPAYLWDAAAVDRFLAILPHTTPTEPAAARA